jgi:signal transduction histidine kinase
MNPREALRPLESRVTLSYLIAFALVLAVFSLAVHLTFATAIERETSERLDAILAEGLSATEAKHGRLHIDSDATQLVAPATESISWYDARGVLVRRIGALDTANVGTLTREQSAPALELRFPPAPTRIVAALDPSHAKSLVRRVDLGLGIGLLLALLVAGIGGRILANRSISRVAATIRTLRDFTADAAHELRGPLTALASNAAASLRDDSELTPPHRRRLETIASTAASMTRTIEDLLLLARAETPLERELFAVDLGELAAVVVDARRALADERNITLEFETFAARVYGNPIEIERIIGNLLDNAIRYSNANDRVVVASTAERGGITLRVRDTGIGIKPEDTERIFERFWREDRVRGRASGTGLGLALARALARRHGGDVTVKSTSGKGSEFTLWLPLRPPLPALERGAIVGAS